MSHSRKYLVPLLLNIALLFPVAGTAGVSSGAHSDSGCVACHTDRDMLTQTLDATEKRISSLIEGPG